MKITNVGRAFPEHADGHAVFLLIDISKRQSSRDWQMSTDDGMPAPEIFRHIRHMHRTAAPFGTTGRLTEQLGHHDFRRDAAIDRHPMVTVSSDHPILWLADRNQTRADRLLTNIQV